MVLLAEEWASPPLIPELPENQATTSNRNDPITIQVRAGCEKKLAQPPQARMVRPSWTITLTVEMRIMRRLMRVLLPQNNAERHSRKKAHATFRLAMRAAAQKAQKRKRRKAL